MVYSCGGNGAHEFDGLNWLQYDAGVSSFFRDHMLRKLILKVMAMHGYRAMGRLYKKSDTTFINYGFFGYDLVVDT
ncbi:MAG: hypothetical protein IPN61_18715 [Bacteroidetes bacterium]|nr:hypothetical protein [Bacteroidota bacterium]